MKLKYFEQVTPDFIIRLREGMGLSLESFWGALACTRSRGLRYENGTTEIPEVVRRLLFLHYGVGIPTDCQSDAFHNFVHNIHAADVLSDAVSLINEVRDMLHGSKEQHND